ncbi:MAG: ATP-binding protein, partial [Anaerolineae bacterium]
MSEKLFDLNIERILENWEVSHALREIIANAMDEQRLTDSAEIEIFKDPQGAWHVRDFGRGVQIEDFILSENPEKLEGEADVIGVFGVGLKDALATFHRHGVGVEIRSRHGTFRLSTAAKHSFDGIETLHIAYDDGPREMPGTDVVLLGVSDADVQQAKSLFLRFAGEEVIESTAYGDILRRKPLGARVYIRGVVANDEPNFLFSYNITDLTSSMRKRLNRERLSVGRTIYAPRIRSILQAAESPEVHAALVEQFRQHGSGNAYDELGWREIRRLALDLFPKQRRVVYFGDAPNTAPDRPRVAALSADATPTAAEDVSAQPRGSEVRAVAYLREHQARAGMPSVPPDELSPSEARIYERTSEILGLVGLDSAESPPVRIVETLPIVRDDVGGRWDPTLPAILVRRRELASLQAYAGTLLREVARVTSQEAYLTPACQRTLTTYLGKAAAAAI